MLRRSVTVLVAALTVVLGAVSPASAGGPRHVRGTETIPVYDFATAIRETVWVESPLDSDGDGARDRIAADIVRPREATTRVPVVMEASPYYACCGRGNESELKEYAADGTVSLMPLYYDNYFVPRGYAFVGVDLSGTARSTGCEDVGGAAEVASAKAVIDWLNGRGTAFDAAGKRVGASWTTGKVGMIGKSWDGSVANGVAATGVRGLETIVPIGAISSWYDYQRYNGILRTREYVRYLHSYVNGRPAEACADELAAMRAASGETTGDFTAYWSERDYRTDARNVRASVFIAHGVNDKNVGTGQFGLWWDALARNGVERKLWLFQAGHEDPFDVRRAEWVRTLHRWFDHELQGLRNGIDTEPRATLETAPGVWTDERDWPARGVRDRALPLGAGTLGDGAKGRGVTKAFTDESLREDALVANPATVVPGRLAFLSAPLTGPLRISGEPSVTLRIQVDKPTAALSARLVDYGTATRVDHFRSEGVVNLGTESCWGAASATDDACYLDTAEVTVTADHAVLTRGWADAAHHRSLRFTTPLAPGRWYDVTVPLNTYDVTVPAGHVLGLVLGQSDPQFTVTDDQNATVTVDAGRSTLTLPATGATVTAPAAPQTIGTTALPGAAERRAADNPPVVPQG
ncbi:X-Pro dipeptidyl-peptidase [Catenuloplanes nepalensis]|uniref:Xaa-Pro dipeptidyl-peptidase n=1 Tax=Catenuloplanes nepalensis TaxID=587533 RepID=A0ABT9MVT5_9ACTN|nr:Xaa-Pro dipeptidyl-peptidase [Catenuloplanes nepalensis]MDP9795376.1 X-Pro dipeptidyl-peptidase [Catenuloplanes nepalensis]